MMKGLEEVYSRHGLTKENPLQHGSVKVSMYEFSSKSDPFYNLRMIMGGQSLFHMEDGIYVRMTINGELFMSDTAMEKRSNSEFIRNANGHILIGGLGLGLLLHNLEQKIDEGKIQSITILENNQEVIDLIEPIFAYLKDKVQMEVICASVYDWVPPKDSKWDTIYMDIWADINTELIFEMNSLNRKYRKYLNKENPNAWQDCWMLNHLRYTRKKEQREESRYGW